MIKTSKALFHHLYQRILPAAYTPGEASTIAFLILEHYFHCDRIAITLDKPLTNELPTDILTDIIERLLQQEPIQYILKEAPFMSRDFYVDPAVLIPRPETEELITHILQENNNKAGLAILDIGTGSGCIAITLAKELPTAQVDGLDISTQALEVAKHNAARWQATVNWIQADILNDPIPDKKWDIFVSNPPYVCFSEKQTMQKRVLAYEPPQALFVSDDTPLIFYERIIELAKTHLKSKGKLYFEINEKFGAILANQLAKNQFKDIKIGKDLQGKDRWLKGSIS